MRSGAAPGRGARGSPIPPESWRPPPVLSLCHTTRGHEATELGTWGGVRPGEHPCPMGGSCPSAPGVGGGTVPGHPLGHGAGDEEHGAGDVGRMAGDRGHMVRDIGKGTWNMGQEAWDKWQGARDTGKGTRDTGHGEGTWGGDMCHMAGPWDVAHIPSPATCSGLSTPRCQQGGAAPPRGHLYWAYWAYWERHQGLCTLGMSRMRPAQAAPAEGSPHLPEHPPEPCGPPQPHREGGCSDLGALPCSPTPLLGSPFTRLGGDPWEGAQPGPCPVYGRFFWGGGNIFLALVGKYWRGGES